MSKDESPGLWDTSSSGHVNSGESYEVSAYRELWEELGIKTVLTPLAKIDACNETYHEHVQVYICKTDASIKINSLLLGQTGCGKKGTVITPITAQAINAQLETAREETETDITRVAISRKANMTTDKTAKIDAGVKRCLLD